MGPQGIQEGAGEPPVGGSLAHSPPAVGLQVYRESHFILTPKEAAAPIFPSLQMRRPKLGEFKGLTQVPVAATRHSQARGCTCLTLKAALCPPSHTSPSGHGSSSWSLRCQEEEKAGEGGAWQERDLLQ